MGFFLFCGYSAGALAGIAGVFVVILTPSPLEERALSIVPA